MNEDSDSACDVDVVGGWKTENKSCSASFIAVSLSNWCYCSWAAAVENDY